MGEVMFDDNELNLFRQWFDAVEDLNPKYLEPEDRQLAAKVHSLLNAQAAPQATPAVDYIPPEFRAAQERLNRWTETVRAAPQATPAWDQKALEVARKIVKIEFDLVDDPAGLFTAHIQSAILEAMRWAQATAKAEPVAYMYTHPAFKAYLVTVENRWQMENWDKEYTETSLYDHAAPAAQIPDDSDVQRMMRLLQLRDALKNYVKAQSRMLEKWADGDENVKQDLWRNLHACEQAGRAALDLTAAAQIPEANADQYYLQDSRCYVGNDVLWWAIDRKGYTTDLRQAHIFTKSEAEKQRRTRRTDIPWAKSYIDSKSRPTVDHQTIAAAPSTSAPTGKPRTTPPTEEREP